MSHQLFVYGTLMSERVVSAVLSVGDMKGTNISIKNASLSGFSRYRIKNVKYPGIIVDQAGMVNGMLLGGLTDKQMSYLDWFEGDEYDRVEVTVESEGQNATAFVYKWTDSLDKILHEPWDGSFLEDPEKVDAWIQQESDSLSKYEA